MPHGLVVTVIRLWCRKSPKCREFEPGLGHPATGKLSLTTQQQTGTCFESGKDRAAKGNVLAPLFICCAQDIQGGESRGFNSRVHGISCQYSDKTCQQMNYISINT